MSPESGLRSKNSLLASLSADTLGQLKQQAVIRSFAAGKNIQYETDPALGAWLIIEGRIQIYRMSADGREQILENLGPGESFNTVPLFEATPVNPASARALTRSQCYFIPGDHFLRLVEQNSDLSFALLKDFAGKLTALTRLAEQLSLHSIRGRLARFLVEQADGTNAHDRWTQDEIAAHLGTVRDVVGRTLRSFEDTGLIQRQQGRIVLLNRRGLEAEMEE